MLQARHVEQILDRLHRVAFLQGVFLQVAYGACIPLLFSLTCDARTESSSYLS